MPFADAEIVQQDRYEHILRSGGPVGARLTAASRRARHEVAAASAHERAIRDVAAGVAGPLLTTYVVWLLRDAHARGIERLYFLSRDAEVLFELADILAPRLGIAIQRRYLYASRSAWHCTKSAWPWGNPNRKITIDDLLARLSLPRDAVAADLAGLGFERFDTFLDATELARLRAYFTSDRYETIAAQTTEGRLLHDYLEQEGLFDEVPKALIDLGGKGSQHHTLCNLLARNAKPLCPIYLFWGEVYDSPWVSLRRCFHFDRAEGKIGRRTLDYFLMEIFCTAEHGTLNGFRQAPDRVEPILAAARTVVLGAWGLPLFRETLAAFARSLDLAGIEPTELYPKGNPALRDMIDRLLEIFWITPTVEEARAWSQFPRDRGSGKEMVVSPIAESYTLADLPMILQRNTIKKRSSFWVGGALALTPFPIKMTVRGTYSVRRRVTPIGKAMVRALSRLRGTSGS